MLAFTSLAVLILCGLVLSEDYYSLLGVSKDADNRDIRRAFKKLALKMHPDKNVNDKEAHEKFVKINKAYEVLKDQEMRKKYDLYGEEGLKDDFGKSWKGSYQSWNYYYESFGIYDDDPEIITLSRSDFEQSVLGSPDTWFINFYSPQCSHCHHLAPAWRQMARELEGVIRIGAVNCEEDWMLCRQQHIQSYPTLVMYPEKEKYMGSREGDTLVEYVLGKLPDNVIDLTEKNVNYIFESEEYKNLPWLVALCKSYDECLSYDILQKLGIILEGLVNVGSSDIRDEVGICEKLDCDSAVTYHYNLSKAFPQKKKHPIDSTELQEILNHVLRLLPGPEEITDKKFEQIQQGIQSTDPWLIEFANVESQSSQDTELKRLRALLPGVHFGRVDCKKLTHICSSWLVRKLPMFVVVKPGGDYEFHHGRFTAHDIATFVRESLLSKVKTLSPDDLNEILDSKDPWFIDFFAPWCPPCMQLLPEWRKTSRSVGHLVKFGTVDCTMHNALCSKHNIRSYPTTILYNESIPHMFHGHHTQQQLEEFIQDTLNPVVVTLTHESFDILVKNKGSKETWVIDFYAPWCGPCQQLAPQWRKLAKMLSHDSNVHVGQVDCALHRDFCNQQGVNSYPSIRLYPHGAKGSSKFYLYNGWNRDANSIQAWIYSYLPSKVMSLGPSEFEDMLQDSEPWLVDFYAPWCGHCQIFAPEFEKVAEVFEGKINTGKVNCEDLPHICHQAGISGYPSLYLYTGAENSMTQNPIGEEIHNLNFRGISAFLERTLRVKPKHHKHDEL